VADGAGDDIIVNGTYNFFGGTANGAGTLQVNGGMDWQLGDISTNVILSSSAISGKSTGNTGGIQNGVLTNNGAFTWSGGTITLGNGTFANGVTGVITLTGDNTMNNNFGAHNLANAGTFTKNGGAGTTTINVAGSNSGTINVTTGIISYSSISFANTGTINSVSGKKFTVSGGNFSLNTGSKSTGLGNFELAGGSVTVNAPAATPATATNYLHSGGTINGTGTLQVNGGMDWQLGDISTNVILSSSAVSGKSTGSTGGIQNGVLTNNGAFTWSGGTITLGNGTFANGGTGVITVTGDNVMNNNFGAHNLANAGTFTKNGGAGTTTINVAGSNSGTINVTTGIISYSSSSFANTGTINSVSGKKFTVSGGNFSLNTGSKSTGAGNFELAGGSVTVNALAATPATATNYLHSGGTINGPGTLLVNGGMDWQLGDISTNVILGNSAISGKSTVNTGGIQNGVLTNNGAFNWSAGTITLGNGTFANGVTGVITVTGDNTMNNNFGAHLFANGGTFTKNTNTGATTLAVSTENTGAIKGIGTLNFASGFTSNGIIAPGTSTGLLTINGAQPLSANSILNIEMFDGSRAGTGHDQLGRNGSITLAGILTVTETGTVPAGVYTIVNCTSGNVTGSFATVNLPPCYTLQVTSTTVQLTKVQPPIPTVNISGLLTFCQGGSVTLTSSAATGNTWSNGATIRSIVVNTSGSFSVTFTNASGCTSPASVATVVIVNPLPATPTISAGGVLRFCIGGSVVLTYSAATGNIWSNGATTQSITVTTSGTFTVNTTDANGCTSANSAATAVIVDPLPATPTISAGGVLRFCIGGSVVLTSSAATGNIWSNGATTQSITVNTSGTFTVNTTNANGCRSANSAGTAVIVDPLPATPTISAGGVLRFCIGGSVVLTSSAASGNIWSNGATTQSITVNANGTFTVNTTNANGCTSANSAATAVIVDPLPATPTISAGGVLRFCIGGSVVLTSNAATGNIWSNGATTQSITVNANGTFTVNTTNANGCTSANSAATAVIVDPLPAAPTGSVTVQPTCTVQTGTIVVTAPSGAGITYSIGGAYQANGTFNNVTAGTYIVTAQNASGCISTATSVTVNTPPGAPVAPTASVTLQPTCTVATGTIVVTAPTGAGITYSIGGAYQASGLFSNVLAGSYNVTAQNSSGCISSFITISVNQQPATPAAPTASVTLQPTCTVATGTIVVTAPTGAGITYSIGGAYQASGTFNNIAAGIYNVTAQNASGCISSATSITVNTPPGAPAAPTASVTVQPTCTVQTGTIVVTAPTGAGITFSIGGAYQASGTFNNVAAGTYNVTAQNASGCISSSTTVTVNAAPSAAATPVITAGGPATFCTGGNVVLTSSAAASYLWSTGAITQSITVTTAGNFSVVVKNSSNCTAASAITIVIVNNCNGVYCAASGTTNSKGYIQKVSTCYGINNNSGWNNGYGNFLNLSATYRKGTCFGIAITPGYITTGCYNPLLFTKVWIDWNQDGDFTDAGELVFTPFYASNVTRKAWIRIPETARTGNTRMRVLMSANAGTTSCGIFTYGEVEDYTISITGQVMGRGVVDSPADYIDEEEPGTIFTVYPNPVADRLVIDRSGYNEAKAGNTIVLMQLVDANGKILLQSKLINLVQAFDVSRFTSGMYIIQIKTNNTVTSKKIFIQH